MRESRCWVQRTKIQAPSPHRGLEVCIAPTQPAFEVCNKHGAPPLQWPETERPPYQDPVLRFQAPRLIALRGGDRNEEPHATENERNALMRVLHVSQGVILDLTWGRLGSPRGPL